MWTNTRAGYGWLAIGLHWIGAGAIGVLYFLGERTEEAANRAERLAALHLHVGVGVLLFAVLAARLLSSLMQTHPAPLERKPALRLAGAAVKGLFLAMIATLLVTGPLAVWSGGHALKVFDWFAIGSPFGARVEWLHDFSETAHGAAANLFWPLLVLHVAGAMKHLVVDRDATFRRILWPVRGG